MRCTAALIYFSIRYSFFQISVCTGDTWPCGGSTTVCFSLFKDEDASAYYSKGLKQKKNSTPSHRSALFSIDKYCFLLF